MAIAINSAMCPAPAGITRRNVIEDSADAFPCARVRDAASKYAGNRKTKKP